MPDSDALGHLYTLQGEASHHADQLRRQAAALRSEADGMEARAVECDRRAAWYGEAAAALDGEGVELDWTHVRGCWSTDKFHGPFGSREEAAEFVRSGGLAASGGESA